MGTFSSSLFPSPPIQISDEEFFAFHSSDRKLYQILIDDLERDPSQSLNIMAFWMWLEKEVCVKVNLIHTLINLPYDLINEVADESVICLLSCQVENLPFSEANFELAVLPNLVHPNVLAKKLCLQDFKSNQVFVVDNVNKYVVNVCLRAFKNIVPKKTHVGVNNPGQTNISRDKGKGVESSSTKNEGFPEPIYGSPAYQPPAGRIMFGQIPASLRVSNTQKVFHSFPVAQTGKQQSHNPITNVSGHASTAIKKEGYKNIDLPDDRTVFITFSNGYPVSEVEVRNFFTRKFGDCIEAIYMQDVSSSEQALFARVVVRSPSFVDIIVEGSRAKYNIYGKHVWARKYVKKIKGSS